MKPATVNCNMFCLTFAFVLLLGFPSQSQEPATIKRSQDVKISKAATTQINVREKDRKLYLEIRPSPDRFELYAGKNKLATIEGRNLTEFDISRYAERAENGRMRISAFFAGGKKFDRTVNISRYLGALKKGDRPASVQTRNSAIAARKEAPSASRALSQTAEKSRIKTTSEKGVTAFLKKIETAGSLEELADAFKKEDFSESEKKLLENELRKSKYRSKIDELNQQSIARTDKLHADRIQKILRDKNNELNKLQEKRQTDLSARNQKAVELFNNLHSSQKTKRQQSRILPNDTQMLTATMRAAIESYPAETLLPMHVDSISPQNATLGQDITIQGRGFGDVGGTLCIIIGDSVSYFRRVSTWTDTRIVATVPVTFTSSSGTVFRGIEHIVGESPKSAQVWVRPGADDVGPTGRITVHPDYEQMVPRITSLSSADLQPGQRLVIQGRNFLREDHGTIRFVYPTGGGTANVEGNVVQWYDTYILVEFPSSLRWALSEGSGSLGLVNHVGRSTSNIVTYSRIPETRNLVIRVLRQSRSISADFLIIGRKETYTDHDFRLINGWEVRDYDLWQGGAGISWGAEYRSRPITGSTNASSRVEIWADLFSRSSYTNVLWIIGPEGLPYR